MAGPNQFADNFFSPLDNFQAKKPVNKSGDHHQESKNLDDNRTETNKDSEHNRKEGRREQRGGGSRDRGRRNQDFKISKEEKSHLNSNRKRVGGGDFEKPSNEITNSNENSGTLDKNLSDQFFSSLDKLSRNEGQTPNKKNQNIVSNPDNDNDLNYSAPGTSNRNAAKRTQFGNERKGVFKEGRKEHAESCRDESSKRNYESKTNKNDNNQDGRFFKRESEIPAKRNTRPMGYKFLESLLVNETSFVVSTLASPRSGYQELLNDRPIRPDLLMLIIEVLYKINESQAYQLKVQILSSTFKPEFIDEIKKFVSLICVEDNRQRLLSMSTFFVHLLTVLDTVVNSLPSTMNEKLKSTLNAMNLSMKSLRDEQKINVSDQLFDQLKELTDQVNSHIEHKNKVEKDQNHVGKKEIPPPNSYRDIPLVPTQEDFMTDKGYLRQNKVKGSYSNVDHYLDVQFRLLREDFIAPLRDGIYEYIEAINTPHGKRRYSNVRIYPKVKFENPFMLRDMFGFYIQFDCDKKLSRRINWEYNKRLCMYGSLLLFTVDNFQTFYLATVAERNIKKLNEGLLFVTFIPGTDVPEYLFDPGVFFVMAESEVYYEAYKHVLSALQRMNDKNFPMQQYIVDVDTASFPPAYLMDKSVYKISDYDVNLLDDNSWPSPEELKLNPAQHQALKSALTNDFVVIQGPPGTGKTFLALKITEILLKNEVSSNTPIVVVCYTNHALDQFLEGILKFTKNVIRIGMQSQNETLQKFTLEEVKKKIKLSRNINSSALFKETMDEKRGVQSKLQRVKEKIEELATPEGILKLDVLRSVITPHHYNELATNEDQVLHWLFCYDDPEFHTVKGLEVAAEETPWTTVAQNQVEAMPEYVLGEVPEDSSGEVPENSTEVPDEDFEEFDDEENARRLADMTEDDFFEEDFFQGEEYARDIAYILTVKGINNDISEIHEEMRSTYFKNDESKYYFEQNCRDKIKEMKWQERFLLKQFSKFSAFRFSPERFQNFQNFRSVWEMNMSERWECYATWVHLYITQLKQIIQHLTKIYQDVLMKLHELRQLEDLRFVQTAAVLGLTTSGAAKKRVLLENLGTKIVIVEEAAEVLEAHIVTSLAQSVQHVILIGDHKQLKPNPAVFKLAKKYNMDCSLFERMINNGLGCSVLNEQHRMRPEIACLITPTIYPHLANHPSTLDRPKIRGIDRFVFFLTHDQPEDQLPDSTSKQNKHEADILMELCKYLLLNEYKPEEITILATYVGQVWYMKKKRRDMGADMRSVRITPVDNFQGEENRIILLSLVRSNKENKIGFLSTENRVCVALSRAREGLYIVGNMDNLTNSSAIWPRIKQRLEENNAFGKKLVLRCERHPEQITQVSHMDHFKAVPQGGCSLKCNTELSCGHVCPNICHIIDRDHGFYKCLQKCERPPCDVEGHKCPLRCWQPCEPCVIKVEKQLPCTHTATLKCHEEPAAHKCLERVPAVHPACNHNIIKFCYLDVANCRCSNKCTIRLPCGHSCEWTCHVDRDPDHLEYKCSKKCVKEYTGCPRKEHPCPKKCWEECEACQVPIKTKLPCDHFHEIPCSTDPDKFKCTRECKRKMSCGHNCKQQCWVTCDPTRCTVLVDKEAECGHLMKNMKCNEPTEKRTCKENCKRILACGHQCSSKCCNDCTKVPCQHLVDSRVAPSCGHPVIKIPCHLNKEGLAAGSDELLQLCKQPCGKLMSCGHVCTGTCGKCLQGRLHIPCQEQCNKTLMCGHECRNKCSVVCPPCLTRKCLIRCSHGRCFKPKTKNHLCFALCIDPCNKKCQWSCEHHMCNRRCGEECDRPACYEPCPQKLECGHDCVGYCGEICPPMCAVCDADNVLPDTRYVVLEDCQCVVEGISMDTLVDDATRNNTYRQMICPKEDCKQPVVNTRRYRYVHLRFRRQVVKIDNIVKNEETQRLLRLHARHSSLLGSDPTISSSMNMVMKECSKPFKFFNCLDQKELGRLIVGCLLQPLATRCVELQRLKYEGGQGADKAEEQRLMFRLEYLADALYWRMDQINYDAVLQIELMIVHVLRLTSLNYQKAPFEAWYDVAPYTWEKDVHFNRQDPVTRLSVTLRTRDSTKQWFECDNQHLYVSENGEACVVCADEAAERQRREEEEARRRENQQRAEGQGRNNWQNRGGRQGPVVTDFRRGGRGRGGGKGRGRGNRGGGQGGRGRGRGQGRPM